MRLFCNVVWLRVSDSVLGIERLHLQVLTDLDLYSNFLKLFTCMLSSLCNVTVCVCVCVCVCVVCVCVCVCA